jgi:hypothetical protein
VPEYVDRQALVALIGTSANAERVTLATDAANLLVPVWCGQVDGPPPVDPVLGQAALELAHELYRAHAAVGGVFAVDDMLARLPADRVRPIRDLLAAREHAWGVA